MNTDRMHLTAQSYWQIAFIYAFTIFFDRSDIAPIHPMPSSTPKILEETLFLDTQDLFDQLMCSFLSNALNRKKPIELSSSTRALYEYINSKIRSQEFDLEYNPISLQSGFKALTSDLKLKILFALAEWQLQDSTAVRTIVDTLYNSTKNGEVNPLVTNPLGFDHQKRAYWQFGDSPYMWREKSNLKSGCEWEIVCRDLDELRQFADKILEQTKSRKEKALAQHIKDILVPDLEQKQKQQEIKDRAIARKLAARLELETPRELPRRTRRKPTRYNYSEDFMDWDGNDGGNNDDDAWEDDENNDQSTTTTPPPPPPTRRPTRSSGRLHGDDAIVSYLEDMEIDSQQQQQQHDNDATDNGTDSNDDDDVDLLSNTKTWPIPLEKKDQTSAPGYYEEKIDEELDIV